MDDIVALSNTFRHRLLTPTPKTLDDIPPLTHTLSQLHQDSTRLLPSKPPPIHSAALRLFSTLNFDTHKLHSAVTSLDSSLFFDRSFPPFHPLRHPIWLAQRAADEARLSNSSEIRNFFQHTLLAHIRSANATLTSNISHINNAFDSQTPARSASYHTRTPTSTAPRPLPLTSSLYPHPSALVPPYFDAIRSIALHGDSPSTATLMHETAASVPEPPHFVETLAVLASVARHTTSERPPPQHLTVWGARVVLEDLFAEHIGGLPSKPRLAAPAAILPRIYDYVRGILPRATETVWPCVYFCFRIGHVEAALHVLREAHSQRKGGFETIITIVDAFLKGRDRIRRRHAAQSALNNPGDRMTDDSAVDAYVPMIPGCLEATDLYEELEREYKEKAWDSNNPYMRISLVLLMRLELQTAFASPSAPVEPNHDMSQHPQSSKHETFSLSLPETDVSLLLGSVEDYLWFRLWLCRPDLELGLVAAPLNSSVVQLEGIQQDIKSLGSEYFDPEGSQPLLFSFVLVTVGLYEAAVSYLAHHAEDVWSHYAAHIGIVLYQLKWLSDENAFHELLNEYVFHFSVLYPVEAALYFMTLRSHDILTKFIRELVLSTKEYDQLLGRSDTPDSEGALAELLRSASVRSPSGFNDNHLRLVRVEVATIGAREASAKGDCATAAKLFNMAGKNTECIEMIMRNLSNEVDKVSSQRRPLAVAEARNALRRSCEDPDEVHKSVRESLSILVKMSQIFDEYWTGRYASAWHTMRDLSILPLSSDRISICYREFVSDKGMLDPSIRRPATETIKAALHIAEYALETGNIFRTGESRSRQSHTDSSVDTRQPESSEIKALCIFASMVGLSEADAHQRMARIELLLA